LIARGNAFVDVFSICALMFYPLLHFADWRTARRFVERVLGDAECLSRILRGEYRPSMAALIGFYAATLLALLTL